MDRNAILGTCTAQIHLPPPTLHVWCRSQPSKQGLGHFGDAVSVAPIRRRCFGDGTFRRWLSQMSYTKKVCFWNTSLV